jgi:hypothetical protein
MQVNTTPATARPVVNLQELAEVRQFYMPTPLVQFSPLCEVARVAAETSRKHPRLAEEAAFVVLDEVGRRATLAGSPLTLS